MNENIFPHVPAVTFTERMKVCGLEPSVLWFTGLSGSGKTTLAREVERRIINAGCPAYLLDGDSTRTGLCAGLGFSENDRAENLRRLAEASFILAGSGATAIVSAISPLSSSRKAARETISKKCPFYEVYVSTPVEECRRRDVKGLYAKAYAGLISDFTGVSAPYEAPEAPDITIDTTGRDIHECADEIMYMLFGRGYLSVMEKAALLAGNEIMRVYRSDLRVEHKDDSSPVTEADMNADRVISGILKERFPYIPVLSEESADDRSRLYSRCCFIVDPLDGTEEYIARNGEFTVNIAFCCDGRIIMGVIYIPSTGEMFEAASGAGAYKRMFDGETLSAAQRIRTSRRTEGLILMESRSHNKNVEYLKLIERGRNRIGQIQRCGSSIKGCRIAEGKADVYYRFGLTHEWDTAAMQCICEQAGAIFLDGNGNQIRYNRIDTLNRDGFYIINLPENQF